MSALSTRITNTLRDAVKPATLAHNGMAGIVATGTMSLVMTAGKAAGLMETPPPKHITGRAAQKIGFSTHKVPQPAFTLAWLAAHLAYGAGAGIVYGAARGFLPRQRPLAGGLYGTALWAVSYLGLMPAMGLYPFATNDRTSRQVTMVVAHEAYGGTLAYLTR